MNATRTPSSRSLGPYLWILVALVLVALRLPHLDDPIGDPHSWRQWDTMHTALDFHRRGIDVLHPAMAWLGGHGTIVLNFPLSEAVTAVLYRAFGPSPMWDRVVSLFFCLIATFYLHGIARLLLPARAARLATLAFLAIPLGQYYSRVPHIEFAVIAFVNGFTYHAIRALLERRWDQALWAGVTGMMAALIKGPYLAPGMFPLALLLFAAPSAAAFARTAVALGMTATAFLLWRHHADSVNALVPDWSFLPGFYKEVNPLWRWIGTLADRLDPQSWIRLARRLVYEQLTPLGVPFAIAAAFHREPRTPSVAGDAGAGALGASSDHAAPALPLDVRWLLLLWWAGCALHVLVFFPLNVEHNYYQMPLLAPVALTLGYGAHALWCRYERRSRLPLGALTFAAFLFTAFAWMPAKLGYDKVDWVRFEAGKRIQAIVPRGDLVVAADFSTLPPIDPRLLAPADRWGWPVRASDITPERLERLVGYGARWVVVLQADGRDLVTAPAFLAQRQVAAEPVLHDGRRLGTLLVYDLRGAVPPAR